jgi:hypothetical protein
MNNLIIRVINNPNSKKTWVVYPSAGLKPFVIDKTRCKGVKLKHNKHFVVELKHAKSKTPPLPDTIFVYCIYAYGELMLGKPTTAKKKGK